METSLVLEYPYQSPTQQIPNTSASHCLSHKRGIFLMVIFLKSVSPQYTTSSVKIQAYLSHDGNATTLHST